MSNILIAYYSFSGTTRMMAEAIAAVIGGDFGAESCAVCAE
ncbi:hypothetical protein EDD59_102157 [Muricomes intestini]|jgi:flavodoxin|uniref:Flavodoxin-like domain-containing protein n=1 Tax=Muricomes intestini TaxID=1796634 RepID=A0A4R3KGY7_9FIRM|nr:flavodoxin family protein [Muricomes intestini]TCS82289.1 hypothetical protein EDD59_102157 [Muricomes intestini]